MTLEEDRQRLREYRDELSRVKREMDALERKRFGLVKVVDGLEAIVGTEAEPETTDEDASAADAAQEQPERSEQESPPAMEPPARRKRLGLPDFLRDLYADGKTRTLDEVMRTLHATEKFQGENMPSRNTVSNRHFDLKNQGYLRQVGRGTYRFASPEADENAGSPQVHTEEPTSPQKPPDEEIAPPRPGHLTNGAGGSHGLDLDTRPEGSTPSGSTRS